MALLDENVRKEVKEFLKDLEDVKLVLYVRKTNCEHCADVEQLLKELSEINDKIKVEVKEAKEADKAPVIYIEGKNKGKLAYLGIPVGHEFGAFLNGMKDASKGKSHLIDEETQKEIGKIDKKVNIKVFVTPSCGYCPAAVITAYGFGLLNDNVEVEVIESMEFADLANLYRVRAVPKIVINDKVEFEGAVPPDIFLKKVLSALS